MNNSAGYPAEQRVFPHFIPPDVLGLKEVRSGAQGTPIQRRVGPESFTSMVPAAALLNLLRVRPSLCLRLLLTVQLNLADWRQIPQKKGGGA